MAIPTGAPGPTVQSAPPARGEAAPPTAHQIVTERADRALGSQTGATGATPTAADGEASRGDAVLRFAQGKVGRKVGDGECFTLADRALRAAGCKSASDYGPVTADGDYQWGRRVPTNEARPGDILQFRDYQNTTRTERSDGGWTEREESRPHHTAVVVSNDGNGNITVLEQNAPPGSRVHTTQLHVGNGRSTDGSGTTTTSRTSGDIWAYRPEPR